MQGTTTRTKNRKRKFQLIIRSYFLAFLKTPKKAKLLVLCFSQLIVYEYRSSRSNSEHETTLNTSSVQESVEKNWEYYENLRKCYDPDSVIVPQVIQERSRSEESTPDMKKEMKNYQSMVSMDQRGKRKLVRRMTTPDFFAKKKCDFDRKKPEPRQVRYSKSFLRKSLSSFDLHLKFVKGQLGAVKEQEDEDLTIPFEPDSSSETEDQKPTPLKGI